MPFVLAAGILNPHHTSLPCVGSIDIGSPPFLSDLAIVFNGTDPMQRFLFTTNALGTAQQTLTLPTLPPGLLGGLQGLILQPSQAPCPFVFTAAFAIDMQ